MSYLDRVDARTAGIPGECNHCHASILTRIEGDGNVNLFEADHPSILHVCEAMIGDLLDRDLDIPGDVGAVVRDEIEDLKVSNRAPDFGSRPQDLPLPARFDLAPMGRPDVDGDDLWIDVDAADPVAEGDGIDAPASSAPLPDPVVLRESLDRTEAVPSPDPPHDFRSSEAIGVIDVRAACVVCGRSYDDHSI